MNESCVTTTKEPRKLDSITGRIAVLGLIALLAFFGNVEIVKQEKRHEISLVGGSLSESLSESSLTYEPSNRNQTETSPLVVESKKDHLLEPTNEKILLEQPDLTKENPQTRQADVDDVVKHRFDSDHRKKHLRLADVHRHFPQCFFDVQRDHVATNFLKRVTTKYVQTNRTPPYDHVSCFLMKARYNCAYPDDNSHDPRAHSYKFLFKDKNKPDEEYNVTGNNDSWCDLDNLVEWTGGPAGIGRILQRETNKTEDEPYQVFIQGNSQLRQVFESLVCRFSDQMSDLVLARKTDLAVAAPVFVQVPSSTGTEKSQFFNNSYSLSLDELRERGCHNGNSSEMPLFYRPNTTIPSSWQGCVDSLASVEFGHSVRFYFVFRPQNYNEDAMKLGYRQIRLTPRDKWENEPVDVVVVNDNAMKTVKFLKEGTRFVWDGLLSSMFAIQKKHLKRFFGANNPWIWKPPDRVHGCMPGIPDDEANLLLFGLLGGL